MRRIILASTSPRRKDILELICSDFVIKKFYVDEEIEVNDKISPNEIVKNISEKKALNAVNFIEGEAIIITADTIVCTLDNEILGKPSTPEDALVMLKKLQGTKHYVKTCITVVDKNEDKTFSLQSDVTCTNIYMRALTEKEIKAYIKTGEPFDKAGSYGVQGKGVSFIEKVEGDYLNVVGMSLIKLSKMLSSLGVNTLKL